MVLREEEMGDPLRYLAFYGHDEYATCRYCFGCFGFNNGDDWCSEAEVWCVGVPLHGELPGDENCLPQCAVVCCGLPLCAVTYVLTGAHCLPLRLTKTADGRVVEDWHTATLDCPPCLYLNPRTHEAPPLMLMDTCDP